MKPNLLVFSDALTFLERLNTESVDLIYLDPPWLTHNTNFKSEEDYQEFLFKILQQSKRILKETGNLVFFSEPSINVNFHPLITKVYGAKNYVYEFVIRQMTFTKNFSQKHQTIIFYKKSDNHIFNTKIKLSKEEIKNLFPFSDNRGKYRLSSLIRNGIDRPNLVFEWRGYTLPENKFWKFSKDRLDALFNDGQIHFSANGTPQLKIYLTENEYKNIGTIWDDIDTRPLKYDRFDYSQSEKLLQRIIEIGSEENQVVLDPFCGSGTSLVVAGKENRRWIGCDNSQFAIEVTQKRLFENEIINFNFYDEKEVLKSRIKWDDYERLNSTLEDEIWEKILNGENDTVEFKESLAFNYNTNSIDKGQTENVLIAISSFLNTESGGTVFIGVRNDKSLLDLREDYNAVNKKKADQDGYELYLTQKISKQLGTDIARLCKITFHLINDKEICMVKIKSATRLVFFDKDFYLRIGNQKEKLSNKDFYAYIKQKELNQNEF